MGAVWSRRSRAAESAGGSVDSSVRICPSEGRGRGVFMARDADAGSAVSCEAPLVAMAPSAQLCASCGRFTGSLAQQLDAHAKMLERSSGRAVGPLPACYGLASAHAACRCAGGCAQMYCNVSCRAQDEALHGLLCPGDPVFRGDADPAVRLSLLIQSGSDVSPCLPLAVRATAWLMAMAIQPGGSFDAARARLEEAVGSLPMGEAANGEDWGGPEEEDCSGEEAEECSEEEGWREECSGEESDEGGSVGEDSGDASSHQEAPSRPGGDSGSTHVLMRSFYPAVWHCLLGLWLERLVTGQSLDTGNNPIAPGQPRPAGRAAAGHALSELSALGEGWFAALCWAVERRALPVVVPNPLQRQLEAVAAKAEREAGGPGTGAGEWERAVGLVACAAAAQAEADGADAAVGSAGGSCAGQRGKRRGRAGAATGDAAAVNARAVNDTSVDGASVNAPAGDASRPSKRARRAAELPSSPRDQLETLLFLVSTTGVEVFPPVVAMALPAIAAVVNHSCAPNCTVRFGEEGGAEGGDGGGGGGGGGGASAGGLGWTPCRILTEQRLLRGEELTISFVDASRPLAERRASLAAVHGFRCECPKCTLEEELLRALSAVEAWPDRSPPSLTGAGRWLMPGASRGGGGRREGAGVGGDGSRGSADAARSGAPPAEALHAEALHALASRALEAGLHAQATALFRRILASDPDQAQGPFIAPAPGLCSARPPGIGTAGVSGGGRRDGRGGIQDGDAHWGLGGALLRGRDFAGAEVAWRAGAVACPWHEGLRREVTTLACYSSAGAGAGEGGSGGRQGAVAGAQGGGGGGDGSEGGEGGAGQDALSECTVAGRDGSVIIDRCLTEAALPTADAARLFRLESHAVSRGRRACVSGAPVLSRSECAWLVDAAEAHASAAGGWSTTRHAHAPTTDLEVHAIRAVLRWFNAACATRLFPLATAAFPELGLRASSVRVSDAFVVRYDADGGQV